MKVKRGLVMIVGGVVLMASSKPSSIDSFSLLFFICGFILVVGGMIIYCFFSERAKNSERE